MDQRKAILAAFARNAINGLRTQRSRLKAEPAAVFDLDYYAHSAYTLRETCRLALQRLGVTDLKPALDRLDVEVPNLRTYRDVMAHALDDHLDHWAWFGEYAGRLQPGGDVDYLIDARHDHASLERLFTEVIAALDPEGVLPEPGVTSPSE